MGDVKTFNEDTVAGLADVLVGRRIVEAEKGSFEVPGRESWDYDSYPVQGRLTLDNGTVIYVCGHDGGCACSAGCYDVSSLATVDNAITSVKPVNKPGDDSNYDQSDTGYYAIFVMADNEQINVVRWDGSDGNGYYGTGYQLIVIASA